MGQPASQTATLVRLLKVFESRLVKLEEGGGKFNATQQHQECLKLIRALAKGNGS